MPAIQQVNSKFERRPVVHFTEQDGSFSGFSKSRKASQASQRAPAAIYYRATYIIEIVQIIDILAAPRYSAAATFSSSSHICDRKILDPIQEIKARSVSGLEMRMEISTRQSQQIVFVGFARTQNRN
jgi:hypothetical protein